MTKSLYAAFGERGVGLGLDPGTLSTASVETIDNDVVLQELAVLTDSEPCPGTRIAGMVGDDSGLAIAPLDPNPDTPPTTAAGNDADGDHRNDGRGRKH